MQKIGFTVIFICYFITLFSFNSFAEEKLIADITFSSTEVFSLVIPGPENVKLTIKKIPAGSFVMGAPGEVKDSRRNEGPIHDVKISKPFYIGIYEVTQGQWEAVMGTNPSKFNGKPNHPVEKISWNNIQEFLEKMNSMGIGTFRLPTEAEWEYACRAGSKTRFYWGDDPGYININDYAWYEGNSEGKTHVVGEKKPNEWGLYDMSGNVHEWCQDWYEKYSNAKLADPKGPNQRKHIVYRGGAWNELPSYCRSTNRCYIQPGIKGLYPNLGFRLVRSH
jgi:formylglycine-generating enzyme required for sulfatase activity